MRSDLIYRAVATLTDEEEWLGRWRKNRQGAVNTAKEWSERDEVRYAYVEIARPQNEGIINIDDSANEE